MAADRPALPFARCFQAMVEVGGSIPRQHLRFIGLAVTFHDLDLLGAPFFRSIAKFWSDTIWIDELLSKARSGEYECRIKNKCKRKRKAGLLCLKTFVSENHCMKTYVAENPGDSLQNTGKGRGRIAGARPSAKLIVRSPDKPGSELTVHAFLATQFHRGAKPPWKGAVKSMPQSPRFESLFERQSRLIF
jgi:hypothetical protein